MCFFKKKSGVKGLCSDYWLDTELEIVTLDNSILGDHKNNFDFIIDNRFIIFIEHQSTVNPNMPLRMLIYCKAV